MIAFQNRSQSRVGRSFRLNFSNDAPGGKNNRSRPRHATLFLPGSPIPATGIFEVIHDNEHRKAHEAVLHGGDLFPLCDQCGDHARFRLVRTVPYIFEDEDFVESE